MSAVSKETSPNPKVRTESLNFALSAFSDFHGIFLRCRALRGEAKGVGMTEVGVSNGMATRE
jgi:hypothetical protein